MIGVRPEDGLISLFSTEGDRARPVCPDNPGRATPSASWSDSAARSVITPRVSAADFLSTRSERSGRRCASPCGCPPARSLAFPKHAGACHICAIAQIRNYRRKGEAESMNPDRALRICRIWRGCFSRYLARVPSVLYLTTPAI